MLMHNKFEPEMTALDLKLDVAAALKQRLDGEEEDAVMKRKQLWEIIVRMHFLSHELREAQHDLGVSPEYTRLVSGLLSEWAVLAEEAVREKENVELPRQLRVGRH